MAASEMLVAGASIGSAPRGRIVQARGEPWATLESITPERAREMLGAGGKNRPISDMWVESIRRDIENGDWFIDGNAIRFGTDGVLMDGQHRLHAISRAGRMVQSFVVRGLEHRAMQNIDRGRARTVADMFKINLGTKAANQLSSTCNQIQRIELRKMDRCHIKLSYAEAAALLKVHYESIDWAFKIGPSIAPGIPHGGAATYAAFAYLWPVNPHLVEECAKRFKTGTGLRRNDPAEAMRRAVANFSKAPMEHHRGLLLPKLLRGVEAFVRNQQVDVLKADPEVFGRVVEMRKKAVG